MERIDIARLPWERQVSEVNRFAPFGVAGENAMLVGKFADQLFCVIRQVPR